MKRVRVGVVGLGFGQQVHVPAFRTHPGCAVVALCGTRLDRARDVAARLGVPTAYGSWQELLAQSLDAVAIAAPPAVQYEIARAALAAGIAVFAEKPLAATVAQAEELAAAARRAGVAHVVDFQFLEVTAWRKARDLLAAGAIGMLRHVSVVWHVETYANRTGLVSWKTASEAGGGTLASFVSHVFYNLEQMAGPVAAVRVCLARTPGDSRSGDALVSATLELASGAVATLSVSGNAPLGSGHRLEFYGDEGALVLANPTADYLRGFRLQQGRRRSGRLEDVDTTDPEEQGAEDGRIVPVARLVGRFLDAVQTGRLSRPDFADGLRVQVLLDAARRAHDEGRRVEVPAVP